MALVYDRAGRADTIAELPFDRYGITSAEPSPILGRPTVGAVAGIQPISDGIVYTTARQPEFRVHSLDGQLRRIVRWTAPVRVVEPADVEAYRADIAGRLAHLPRRFTEARTGDHVPVADSFPALLAIRASLQGDVWVLQYPPRPGAATGERQWLVSGPHGNLRCRTTLPHMIVYDVGADFIRGRVEDDLGVEYVVEYEVTDPSSTS